MFQSSSLVFHHFKTLTKKKHIYLYSQNLPHFISLHRIPRPNSTLRLINTLKILLATNVPTSEMKCPESRHDKYQILTSRIEHSSIEVTFTFAHDHCATTVPSSMSYMLLTLCMTLHKLHALQTTNLNCFYFMLITM